MAGRIDFARRALMLLPQARRLRPECSDTVADLIEARALEHGDRPYVKFREAGISGHASDAPMQVLTYAQLNARANRVAGWALRNGIRPRRVVSLVMENRPEFLIAWAGIAKTGATTALINHNLTGKALAHALSTAGAETVIVGDECLQNVSEAVRALDLPLRIWRQADPYAAAAPPSAEGAPTADGVLDLDEGLEDCSEENPHPSVRDEVRAGDDLFYIYTSGTTGLPNAARFSHLRFFGVGMLCGLLLRMDPGHVHYCALPLYHSAGGTMQVGAVLATGATLALRRKFSASAFWDDCRAFDATHFQYIGEFCRHLLNQPPRADDRDHKVTFAIGNGLRTDIWKSFRDRFGLENIIEFYGATESNTFFVNTDGRPGVVGRIPGGRLGKRFSNSRLIRFDIEREEPLRDEQGFCIECDPDEPGELIGRITDGTFGRYEGYTSAEASEKKIMRNVFEKGDAWFKTGDLLRVDPEGWYSFFDRIGDTFRWKGENVSTQEVAEHLSSFPGIEQANVYGVRVEAADGRAGMAALVLDPGVSFDATAFGRYVSDRMPAYAAPVFIRVIAKPDMTSTFKLRKVGLQREGFDLRIVSDPIWVRDEDGDGYVPLTRSSQKAIENGSRRL